MKKVTDPELLAQLNGKKVTDPAILAQLNQVKAPIEKESFAETAFDQGLQGATFGFADEITDRIGAGIASLATDQSYRDLLKEARQLTKEEQARQFEQRPATTILSNLAGGVLTGGAGATTKAGSALANSLRSGNTGARIGKGMLAGASSGALYGAGAADDGNRAEGAVTGGILGGVTGGAIPAIGAAGSGVKKQVSKVLSPAIDETKASIVPLAKKYNIPLALDDVAEGDFYKTLIDEGGKKAFSGAPKKQATQLQAFQRALGKTIGLDDADSLTPDVMEKAYKGIGRQFDDLTKGKTFKVTDDVVDQLDEIRLLAEDGAFGSDGLKTFERITKDLFAGFDMDGTIQGEKLARVRSRLNGIGRKGSDPNVKTLASNLESAVVDIIGEDAPEALKKAKYQYKNFIALEPLAQKAQVDGFISPAQLSNRVKAVYKRDYTLGKAGELGDLAKIGQVIKQQIPNSGTAQRNAANKLLSPAVDMGALSAGFYNPAIPAMYFGGKGVGLLGNRALQSRNYNPKVLEKALNPKLLAPSTAKTIGVSGAAPNILLNR